MLRHEELAFIKANSKTELSLVFLRELRKLEVAGKKKKALATSKATLRAIRPTSILEKLVVRLGPATKSPQLNVSKEAEELSSSDCPSKPVSRPSAPGASVR
jgi:hypothetical protein